MMLDGPTPRSIDHMVLYGVDENGLVKAMRLNDNMVLMSTKHKVQTPVSLVFSSTDPQTLIPAPGAGKRIRVTFVSFESGADAPVNIEVTMKSGSNVIEVHRGSAIVINYNEHSNLNENEALVVQATTSDRIISNVKYYEEDV